MSRSTDVKKATVGRREVDAKIPERVRATAFRRPTEKGRGKQGWRAAQTSNRRFHVQDRDKPRRAECPGVGLCPRKAAGENAQRFVSHSQLSVLAKRFYSKSFCFTCMVQAYHNCFVVDSYGDFPKIKTGRDVELFYSESYSLKGDNKS